MKSRATLRRAVGLAVLVTAIVTVPPVADAPPAAAAGEMQAGGEFHPLTPTRILDTRPGSAINDVSPAGKKPMNRTGQTVGGVYYQGATFDIQLLGQGGIPNDATVLAAAVSITVVDPESQGNLGAFPTGSPAYTSIINFASGATVPNLSIVRAGSGGKLTIRLEGNNGTKAHVLVDVFGYFTTSASTDRGARLRTVTPARVLDTRNDLADPNDDSPIGATQTRSLTVRGAGGVPSGSNVVGAVLNVTVVGPTEGGFVSVLPAAPSGVPGSSNLNFAPGAVKANLVMTPLSGDGKVFLYNQNGNTNVIVDVVGYLLDGEPEATRLGRVVPLTAPYRVFHTGIPEFGQVPLGPGQAEDWSFANFAGSVTINGTPVGAQDGLIGNLTALQLIRQSPSVAASGYLSMFPGTNPPNVSNLNPVESVETPNMAIVKYGTNQVARAYNGSLTGKVHYLLDVSAVILKD